MMHSQYSCNNVESKKNSTVKKTVNFSKHDSIPDKFFNADWNALTKDYMKWHTYTYYNVLLSEDFIGLDTEHKEMNKKAFLNELVNENVVAFKTKVMKGKSVYQLFELNADNKMIRETTREMASTEIRHLKLVGSDLPKFDFTDLNGKMYNKLSTKGKLLF